MSAGIPGDFDPSGLYKALSNPNLSTQFMRQNQKEAVDEDLGLFDYPLAAYKGLEHGVTIAGPETMYRVLHRLGNWFGSEDTINWTREKLDEIKYNRANDPLWQPDERWMNDTYAKWLYEGFNSIGQSAVTAIPGLAAAPFTGGTSLGALYFASAVSGNSLAGLAEYDRFLDDAYDELSGRNPHISRADIEDEHFSNALISGAAEGGLGLVGDYLGGKLMGLIGKGKLNPATASAKELAKEALENQSDRARGFISKAFRNSMRNVLTEVPEEMAVAGIQDRMKQWSGLDHQGIVTAMKEAFGPSLVAGGAFGVAGTAMQSAQQMLHPTDVKAQMDNLVNDARQQELKGQYGEAGYNFMQSQLSGLDEGTATGVMQLAQQAAQRWGIEHGQDANSWYTNLTSQIQSGQDGQLQQLQSLVQAFMAQDGDLGSVVNQTLQPLIGGLGDDAKASLTAAYGVQDASTGQVSMDTGRLAQDVMSYIQDPENTNLPPAVAEAFDNIQNTLTEGYAHLREAGGVRSTQDTTKMFDSILEKKGVEAPKPPPVFELTDPEGLDTDLANINLNSPDVNDKLATILAKRGRLNLSPFTVPPDGKAVIAAIDNAYSPIFAKYLTKQTDASADARIQREFESKGYNVQGVDSLFADTVGHEEGNLSYRIKKALLYETVVLKHFQETAREYQASQTPQAMANLFHARAILGHVHSQIRAVGSEQGRALRAFRFAGQNNQYDMRRLNELNERLGGAKTADVIAKLIADAGDDNAKLREAAETTTKHKFWSMMAEHTTLSMLTNPATHVVNFIGNAGTLTWEVVNRGFAGLLNKNGMNGVQFGEVAAMLNGFKQGVQEFWKAWGDHKKTNGGWINALRNLDDMNEMGLPGLTDDGGIMDPSLTYDNAKAIMEDWVPGKNSPGALSAAHAKATHGLATAVDWYGNVLNLYPSKALMGSDMLFKTVAYCMERNALAYRRARQAETRGEDFGAAYKKYVDKKTGPKEDDKAAMEFAKMVTFQSDLGTLGKKMNEMRQASPALRIVIPFLKTPINILKYGAAHTPYVGRLVGEINNQLNSQDLATRQLAEARVMAGTMVWAGALGLAAAGYLTGNGPKDPEERKKLQANGWQSNSIRLTIDGKEHYIGIDRLDPGAFILNTAASFVEISEHLDNEDLYKAVTTGLAAALKTVSNRSYLQSVDTIMNIFMNLDSAEGQRAARDLIGNTAIPASALMRTTARVIDPIGREANSLLDHLASNIPGLSRAAPERRNFLGEIMDAPNMAGPDWFSPLRYSSGGDDPVYKEAARLSQLPGVRMPGQMQRTVRHKNQAASLDARQYAAYQEYAGTKHKINGKTLKQALNTLVESPSYERSSDERKGVRFYETVRRYRDAAKKNQIRTNPEWRYLLGLD